MINKGFVFLLFILAFTKNLYADDCACSNTTLTGSSAFIVNPSSSSTGNNCFPQGGCNYTITFAPGSGVSISTITAKSFGINGATLQFFDGSNTNPYLTISNDTASNSNLPSVSVSNSVFVQYRETGQSSNNPAPTFFIQAKSASPATTTTTTTTTAAPTAPPYEGNITNNPHNAIGDVVLVLDTYSKNITLLQSVATNIIKTFYLNNAFTKIGLVIANTNQAYGFSLSSNGPSYLQLISILAENSTSPTDFTQNTLKTYLTIALAGRIESRQLTVAVITDNNQQTTDSDVFSNDYTGVNDAHVVVVNLNSAITDFSNLKKAFSGTNTNALQFHNYTDNDTLFNKALLSGDFLCNVNNVIQNQMNTTSATYSTTFQFPIPPTTGSGSKYYCNYISNFIISKNATAATPQIQLNSYNINPNGDSLKTFVNGNLIAIFSGDRITKSMEAFLTNDQVQFNFKTAGNGIDKGFSIDFSGF